MILKIFAFLFFINYILDEVKKGEKHGRLYKIS